MPTMIWQKCLKILQKEYPIRQFNTYLRPLKDEIQNGELVLLAPKKYIVDKVNQKFIFRIKELIDRLDGETVSSVCVKKETGDLKNLDSSVVTFFSELVGRLMNIMHH